MTALNPHVKRNVITTDYPSGNVEVTPAPAGLHPDYVNDLVGLINILKCKDDWQEVTTVCGGTGYLDSFKDSEPNGYGKDKYGRSFVQMNVVLPGGKQVVLRVFERYAEESTVLVSTTAARVSVFRSALTKHDFRNFMHLILNKESFTQSTEDFPNPIQIAAPMNITVKVVTK